MKDLHLRFIQKFKDVDISRQYLSKILRDNNITRKRATFERWIKNLRFFIHPTFNKIKINFYFIK